MRQAQTLNEAQFRRILHYCRSRRHPVPDTTLFMVSFYAGLWQRTGLNELVEADKQHQRYLPKPAE